MELVRHLVVEMYFVLQWGFFGFKRPKNSWYTSTIAHTWFNMGKVEMSN